MPNKPPAFQFYPKDWLADEKVKLMLLSERGAYITLLAHCWNEGSIPDDIGMCSALCDCEFSEMESIWPTVRARFLKSKRNGRLTHKRLELEKKEQKRKRMERSESGKKSAEKRRRMKEIGNTRSNKVQQPVETFFNSSSSTATATATATNPKPLLRGANGYDPLPGFRRVESEYPKEVLDADCRAWVGIIERAEDEALFFETLPAWKLARKAQYFPRLEKFLIDGYWKKTPKLAEDDIDDGVFKRRPGETDEEFVQRWEETEQG